MSDEENIETIRNVKDVNCYTESKETPTHEERNDTICDIYYSFVNVDGKLVAEKKTISGNVSGTMSGGYSMSLSSTSILDGRGLATLYLYDERDGICKIDSKQKDFHCHKQK